MRTTRVATIITLFAWSSLFVSRTGLADTCAEIGDPAAEIIANSYCILTDPGDYGGSADIQVEKNRFTVVGKKVDVILPMIKGISDLDEVAYTTSLTWTTPMPIAAIRAQERAVSFHPSPRVLVHTLDTDSAVVPDSFQWILDSKDLAIGWQVATSMMGAASGEVMDHHHMTTHGLPAGEVVTFSHRLSGGSVVALPEPSSMTLVLFAVGICANARRRRSNANRPRQAMGQDAGSGTVAMTGRGPSS